MVLRRCHRRALARAQAGDFAAARRELEPLALESRAAARSLGRLACLLGDYTTAEALLHPRRDAATLALVHWRTGRFEKAREVRGMPLSRLMTAFGDAPYRIDWHGEREAVLPFLQRTDWELPTVEIEVEGRTVEAWIDTGGDTLTLPHDWGVEPLASFEGSYAGGAPGEGAYARVESVRLGPVTVRAVPVMTAGVARPVIGTGFLSRFLPTLDYPAARLILRPRGAEPPCGAAVPFALGATHLLIVRGSLEGTELTFVVDSGLEHESGAAFTAPAATLAAAGIPLPETRAERGISGAGDTTLELGRFAIARLGVGALEQEGAVGLYSAFPPELARAAGFPIHGLVNHGFLRHFRWTIDFTRMTMRFEPGA